MRLASLFHDIDCARHFACVLADSFFHMQSLETFPTSELIGFCAANTLILIVQQEENPSIEPAAETAEHFFTFLWECHTVITNFHGFSDL